MLGFYHLVGCGLIVKLYLQSTALGSCNEKTEWIENTPEATVEDFLAAKSELEKQVEGILNKAGSPGNTPF